MNVNNKKTYVSRAIQSALLTCMSTAAIAEGELETITVTANRSEQAMVSSLSSQYVITRTDIEKIQPHSILDLLKNVAGFDFTQQGGIGQQSSVFVRGANSNHTLVLLDGIRLSSATLGTTELQTISPEQIERIEIVKGPRAAIWGSDAIGGVIQIFTRKSTNTTISLKTGSDGYQQAAISASLTHGDGRSTLTINKEKSDGFDVLASAEEDDDGYDYLSIALKGQQSLSKQLAVDWLVQTNQNDSEYDNAYGGNNEAETDNYAWLARVSYETKLSGMNNFTTVSLGQNKDSSRNFKLGSDPMFDSLFETNRDQFSVVNHSALNSGVSVTVGVDYNIEKIDSSTAFVNEERNVLGVFAQTSLEQDSYDLEAAIRFDEVEDLDSETSFNLSTGKELTDTLRLVASYGTGFKTPTFNDLYYPSGVYSSGNADLKAETSDSAELILQFQQDKLTASVSVYKTNVENLIQWQADANFVYKPQNIAKVNIQGIEAEAQYIAEYGTHNVNFSINESVDDTTDKQLIRRSKEHFNYSFSTTVGDADVYVEYQYKGKSYDEDFVLGRLTLPSYSLLNLAVSYPITDNLSVNGRISNGLDEEYQSAYNYNTAGQKWYLGLTYSL